MKKEVSRQGEVMPYITESGRKLIDNKIDALLQFAFGTDPAVAVVKSGNEIFFWYHFLETLYCKLCKEVTSTDPFNGMRYRHYNALHGALVCALEELFSRWSEGYIKYGLFVVQLEMHAPRNVEIYKAGVDGFLSILKREKLEELVEGLLKSFSPDFLSAKVGDINYAISEVANVLGNSGKLSHQEMLDAFVSINHALYRDYVFPYEKAAVAKNGDTRGFLEFWRTIQERFQQR